MTRARSLATLIALLAAWVLSSPSTVAAAEAEPASDERSSDRGLTIGASDFPLRLDATGHHLVTTSGRPLLLHGDTAWSLIAQLTREEATVYLDDRARRGFNAILVNLVEHKFATRAPANAAGVAPFRIPGRFDTPDDAYFDHAVWVVQRAAERGILVLLSPTYAGTGGGDEGWYQDMVATGAAGMARYGRYIAARFADAKNVLWVHGGDYDPPLRWPIATVARKIQSALPGSLATAHLAPETHTDVFWRYADWLRLSTVYTYRPVHLAAFAHHRRSTKPFVMIESAYENEHDAGAWRVRVQAYQALLSGAIGHVYGNHPMWHFGAKGSGGDWRGALDSPGARSMTRLGTLLARGPWWLLRPDSDHSFLLTPGIATNRAVAAVATSRPYALVYLPARRVIQIDLSRWAQVPLVLRWFDPEINRSREIDLSGQGPTGIVSLRPPDLSDRQTDDWLLEVRPAP